VARLQDVYDEFEEDILSKRQFLSTIRMYTFRRQIFVIKRLLKQTNDALWHCKDFWQEEPSMQQDLRENIDQLYFRLDELSANFEHLFQLYVSLNDQRANEVMKTLTVFSSILLPLNFIASFYGMNFTQIPGLESWGALVVVCLGMLTVAVGAIWYFHRRGWFQTAQD
jgi:magnesium transporter